MIPRLILRSAAEADLVEANQWYEALSPGLGASFITCIDATFSLIERFPEISPVYHLEYRRRLIPRFPYSIFYIPTSEFISVGAIFQLNRDPNWIKDQLARIR